MSKDVTPPVSIGDQVGRLLKWQSKRVAALGALLAFIASLYWQALGHHFGLPVNFGASSVLTAFPVIAGWVALFSVILGAMALLPAFLLFSRLGERNETLAAALFDASTKAETKRALHVRWGLLAMGVMAGWLGILSFADALPAGAVAALVLVKLAVDNAAVVWVCWPVMSHPTSVKGWGRFTWKVLCWWLASALVDFIILVAGSSTPSNGTPLDVGTRATYAVLIAGIVAMAQLAVSSTVARGWYANAFQHAFLAALFIAALPLMHVPLAATMAAAPFRMSGPDGNLCVVLAHNEGKVASGWQDVLVSGTDHTKPLRMAIRVDDVLYLKEGFLSPTSIVPANELRRVDLCPKPVAAVPLASHAAPSTTVASSDWQSPAFWVSVISLVVAFAAFFSTRKLWREGNRPLLAVRIRSHSGGNLAIALELVVENVGTRPALDIHLSADEPAVRSAFRAGPIGPMPKDAHRVLFDGRCLPVLANGKETSNAFGHLGSDGDWIPGARFDVDVRYRAMDGRTFTETFPVVLSDDAGFAGTSWATPSKG